MFAKYKETARCRDKTGWDFCEGGVVTKEVDPP